MREADVAVRLTPPRQSDSDPAASGDLSLSSLCRQILCSASTACRSGSRIWQTIGLITYGEEAGLAPFEGVDWITTAGGNDFNSRVVLRVNNFMAIHRAVAAGVGVGVLPDYLARGDENLVRILEDFSPPEVQAFFVYPEELRNSKRIGALRDFLLKKITDKENPF